MQNFRTRTCFTVRIATSLFAIPASLAFAGLASAGELTIVIAEVQEPDGKLMIELLPSAAAMAGDGASTAALILPAALPLTRVTLGYVPEGRYAIRVMHDLDGDGELARNLVGMPAEPWGVSNDAKGNFGPPSFDDAAFTVTEEPLSVEITLNN